MTTPNSSSHYPTPMASYSQPTDDISNRRPPSVNSRSATTRRHRSSRSHSGGASYRPQNEFPIFSQTGDVEIIINADGQEKRYVLHRLILAQWSGFFEASTSEDWSKTHSRAQAPEMGITQNYGLESIEEDEDLRRQSSGSAYTSPQRNALRWRYELDWGNGDDEVPLLVQKVVSICPHFGLFLTTKVASHNHSFWGWAHASTSACAK